MGVPNTLANPALTPQATKRLRNSVFKPSKCPMPDASVAPICEHGPSLPAEPPLAKVTIAATGLTSTVLKRSEEHTSELQSLMRISYAVVCLTKKNTSPTY